MELRRQPWHEQCSSAGGLSCWPRLPETKEVAALWQPLFLEDIGVASDWRPEQLDDDSSGGVDHR
jgi:hypothetical protein